MLLRQEQWAQQALRVLGFAYQEISAQDAAHLSEEELEKDLTLLGICGMIDPPRGRCSRIGKNMPPGRDNSYYDYR